MSKRIRVKPGKTQSMAGFAAGTVFCLLGVLVVIPMAGLFGVIWTVFAGIITAVNGLNAFSDQGVASHEIIMDDDTEEGKKDDIEYRLKTAEELFKEGTITEEEYKAKREEILRDL